MGCFPDVLRSSAEWLCNGGAPCKEAHETVTYGKCSHQKDIGQSIRCSRK